MVEHADGGIGRTEVNACDESRTGPTGRPRSLSRSLVGDVTKTAVEPQAARRLRYLWIVVGDQIQQCLPGSLPDGLAYASQQSLNQVEGADSHPCLLVADGGAQFTELVAARVSRAAGEVDRALDAIDAQRRRLPRNSLADLFVHVIVEFADGDKAVAIEVGRAFRQSLYDGCCKR